MLDSLIPHNPLTSFPHLVITCSFILIIHTTMLSQRRANTTHTKPRAAGPLRRSICFFWKTCWKSHNYSHFTQRYVQSDSNTICPAGESDYHWAWQFDFQCYQNAKQPASGIIATFFLLIESLSGDLLADITKTSKVSQAIACHVEMRI